MSSKTLLLVPMLGLVGLLSACAGPMPKADPHEAWIGLQEETQNDLLAERLDGKKIDDGRYFEVTPGSHRLQVMLFEERTNDDEQTCQAEVDYTQFKAGEHYKLVQSSLGEELHASLKDSHGKTVVQTDDFNCMPG
jgi:hypothetical protein